MYNKTVSGIFKHFDFLLLDLFSLLIAFFTAYIVRFGLKMSGYYFKHFTYLNLMFVVLLIDFLIISFNETFKNVLKRENYKEIAKTFNHVVLVTLSLTFYLVVVQKSEIYSRTFIFYLISIYAVFSLVIRHLYKKYFYYSLMRRHKKTLMIVTTSDGLDEILNSQKSFSFYNVKGLAILDQNCIGQEFGGLKVIADERNVIEYLCGNWVDEIFVSLSQDDAYQSLIDKFIETGTVVHTYIAQSKQHIGRVKIVEKLGEFNVITCSINCASVQQLVVKRLFDIFVGIVGCFFTLILVIVIGPIIYLKSPGPIFFNQIRVGRNGKKFKMYKFRSMYMDAEERKQELMKQNRIKDGMMFKMDFDPRIIGNTIDKNGKRKKGIGNFIRTTSLDEFPQFFNVLKGDMSLIGTRPPTVDEFEKYQLHHHARLAFKPGLTGMWQVNGRSRIVDFEEVVKLDTQYIEQWSISLDIKIIFKTISVLLKKDGSM
ncbi:MAG: sugar transferase [Erysipelotrichaceae bacterium]|nr:sugar transferase [Erysipelotrichaceae bacterium]